MFCPQCGAPNEPDAVFCGNCGAVLNPEAELPATEIVTPMEDELPATEIVEPVAPPDSLPEAERVEPIAYEKPGDVEEAPFFDELPPAPPPPAPPSAYATKQTSGMAIASLIMGILGWTLLPWLGSLLALLFGYMARSEIRQRPDELEGDGLAVAGLVLGWLMIGVSVVGLCVGGLGFGLCFLLSLAGMGSGY